MPTSIRQRPATPEEMDKLQEWAAEELNDPQPSRLSRRIVMRNAVQWLLVGSALWVQLIVLVDKVFKFGLEATSPATLTGLVAIVAACSAYAWHGLREFRDAEIADRSALLADIAAAVVQEERQQLIAARCLRDKEHRLRTWLLRTDDDRVLALPDDESVQLSLLDLDPDESGFNPTSELLLVRASHSQGVLDYRFSGQPIPIEMPLEFRANYLIWPSAGQFCDIPWDELEKRLGTPE